MTKKKTYSEAEHLRSIVRSQKKEIQALQKQVSRQNKRKACYEDLEEKLAEAMIEEDRKETKILSNRELCPECGKGLDKIDLSIRWMFTCECGYRKVVKKK